jgi:hypothetical protein
MSIDVSSRRSPRRGIHGIAAVLGSAVVALTLAASAQANLLISGSEYAPAEIQTGVTQLPPGCTTGCVTANTDGTYPFVFNNDIVDSSFGVTSKIFLDQVTPSGTLRSRLLVPPSQLVTSFSSKSELALNLSTNRRVVTFMGYVAPPRALDVSNSNTPGVFDSTNPVPGSDYRAVAELTAGGHFSFTETNAYSGNNGRAAILNNQANQIYTAGNAGNGSNPQPDGIVLGAGAQIFSPSLLAEAAQSPVTPTPLASFNITELPGNPAPDKIGKDDNFRGLTISGDVVYYTKGSGSNGVDTVYFVDTSGNACPSGTGLPQPGARLPTSPLAYDPATLSSNGLPSNMCVLQGFPTTLAKNNTTFFPFGIWFANPHTLYVADEGDGDNTFSHTTGRYPAAAAQTEAGLQKWVFDADAGSWKLAYTLQAGLDLGTPYTIAGYPTGNNAATDLPWAPATDGLRNITGRVNRDGIATIYAVTSTVSGNGDQGADPNKVLAISDRLSATAPGTDRFRTVRAAGYGQVLRGVSFTPTGERSR